MSDLKQQLHRLDLAEAPDIWPDASSRVVMPSEELEQGRSHRGSRIATAAVALAVFVVAAVFAWQVFRPAATTVGSSSPTPPPGMAVYTDPLGWTAFYPSGWSVTTLQKTSDGLGAGVIISNHGLGEKRPVDDFVVLTITHPLEATPDPSASSSSFPMSVHDFGVNPGTSNTSVLEFRIEGVRYLASLRVGAAAPSADKAAMEGVIASIRPPSSTAVSPTEQVIGFHGLLLTVPSSWKINDTTCGTPQGDTVVRDQGATASCLAGRPPGISSVEFVDDPDYWLSQIDSSMKAFTNSNGVHLESGTVTGRRDLAIYVPSTGALMLFDVASGAESNAIIDSIQLADTDPNGCAMHETQLDPPPSYVPPASTQVAMIPGSPTSIAICHYVDGWLASSASEMGSEMDDLLRVVNAVPEGFVHPPADTYDPTQCDQSFAGGGERGSGLILWVNEPDAPPAPLWAHVGFCGHLGITNGSRDGQLTPELAAALYGPLHAGYAMPGRLIPDPQT